MRNIEFTAIASIVILAVVGLAAGADPQKGSVETRVVTLKVPDMFCGGCEAAVRIAAKKVDGVKDVKTSAARRTAQVTFDPSKTNGEAIAGAITKNSGFKVEVLRPDGLRHPA